MNIKTIFSTFFLLLGLCFLAAAQDEDNAIDKYFKQYVDDERFSVVYISPKLFEMLGKLNVENISFDDNETQAVLDMAKDLRGLRILTSEENTDQFYKEAKSKINTKEYEVLMTIRSKEEGNIEFLVKEQNNVISELLLLGGGNGNDFMLMSFIGKIDLEKVARLAREMEK